MSVFTSIAETRTSLDAADYLVDDGMSMALFLAVKLGQPLLLEGEPGVGKTTAAKALAAALGTELIAEAHHLCRHVLAVPGQLLLYSSDDAGSEFVELFSHCRSILSEACAAMVLS